MACSDNGIDDESLPASIEQSVHKCFIELTSDENITDSSHKTLSTESSSHQDNAEGIRKITINNYFCTIALN